MPSPPGAWLTVVVILGPLLGAVGAFVAPRLARSLVAVSAALILAAVLGLARTLAEQGPIRYAVGGWSAPLGIELYLDGLSLFMLLASALTGAAVCLYAVRWFHDETDDKADNEADNSAGNNAGEGTSFWPLWLMLWASLNALYLSGDVFNLYVTLELAGLCAVLLVALSGTADALTGAMRYLLMTMVASLIYLLGVGLLYHQAATLDIGLLGETLRSSSGTWIALGLMCAALLLKSAVFPLHFWLPFAYASAPVPAGALLAALVSKATLYLLVRLWLDVMPAHPPALGRALAGLGAAAILWGSVQALRQTDLRRLVAYSTAAQAGYLLLPFTIRGAELAALAWRGAMYFLLCYALAKATMFMAVGNMSMLAGGDRIGALRLTAAQVPVTLFAFGIAGLTVIGLPPSGGFLGKWMLLRAAFLAGQYWLAVVVLLGGLLSAAYIFKVVGLAFTEEGGTGDTGGSAGYLQWVTLAAALLTLVLGFTAPGLLGLLEVGSPFAAPPGAPVP